MKKQQERDKIIHKIISSNTLKSSKKKGKRNPSRFIFDLDRLAHHGEIFCAGLKVSGEWKENFRMSQESFEKLCTELKPYIQKNKTRF